MIYLLIYNHNKNNLILMIDLKILILFDVFGINTMIYNLK